MYLILRSLELILREVILIKWIENQIQIVGLGQEFKPTNLSRTPVQIQNRLHPSKRQCFTSFHQNRKLNPWKTRFSLLLLLLLITVILLLGRSFVLLLLRKKRKCLYEYWTLTPKFLTNRRHFTWTSMPLRVYKMFLNPISVLKEQSKCTVSNFSIFIFIFIFVY
jgi:hypothetical protein